MLSVFPPGNLQWPSVGGCGFLEDSTCPGMSPIIGGTLAEVLDAECVFPEESARASCGVCRILGDFHGRPSQRP